ncbi:hypothetical protein ABZ128_34100 [Streptomyces sp. NPDC006326]|uniref:DUF7544 domain-containing protein n=1 Tax=Streptomyces sp. NPDC006326 TaxID=3156752 RepID=UPI0033B6F55D
MNDSPGWATPGSSPSDGERPGAPDGQSGDGTAPPAAGGQKWSAQQPPPGDWSSPGLPQAPPQQQPQPAQPGAGQYGHGYARSGGPGQWGGQWGKPPAAKPGVIPLRPLGVGEILDGAVAAIRTHWRSVLSLTGVVAVCVQVGNVLLQKNLLSRINLESFEPGAQPTMDEINDLFAGTLLLGGGALFLQLVAGLLVTSMLTMIFSRAVLGRPSTVSAAWREARPQLPKLLGLTLLTGLGAILIGAVLILPGVLMQSVGLIVLGVPAALVLITWLWIRFSLASPALMLERASILTAFARSARLVRGSWWRIFGITLLTGLITSFLAGMIGGVFNAIAFALFGGGVSGMLGTTAPPDSWGYLITAAIGGIIGLVITMPMQSGVTVLLYVDQRIRREALDLELARAAGLEDYGTEAAAPPTGN